MLEVVEHQNRLSPERFHQFQKGFNLAAMHFMHLVVIVINRPVCQLQQLIAECCRACNADLLFVLRKFQNHLPFQLMVCFSRLSIQHNRDLMICDFRKLQIIFGLHGNTDV